MRGTISISPPLALHSAASRPTTTRHCLLLRSCPLYPQNSTATMQESPVRLLSFDTLCPIFELAVGAGKTPEETTEIPLTLSQVCTTWRQSALRHAPLWTSVLLDAYGDRSLERATEFLSRSRTLPVCFTLDVRGVPDVSPSLKAPVGFLAPYAHRLRTLRVRGATTAPPVHQFLRYLDFTLADLKEFEIIWGKPTTRPARCFPVILQNQIPASLLPYYLNLSPHDKFTNLTRFALKTFDHRLEIKLDQVLEILGGNPKLESLELQGFYFDYEDDEFYHDDDQETEKLIPQLPHLRFLSLKRCLSGAFLPRINVPPTTNVVLAANDPWLDDGGFDDDTPSIIYALPPNFYELSFIVNFQNVDFEIQDSGITLRFSQPGGHYLLIEQVPDPDDILNNTTIEEIALASVTCFVTNAFGPVKTLRAINRLSESKRRILRDADPRETRAWLSPLSHLEKVEISYFPLNFLEGFSGDKDRQELPMAAKDVTLTLYSDDIGDFAELMAWVKARVEARLSFEKLEIALDCSVTPPADEKFVDSLRSSLAEYIQDVVVKVLHSPREDGPPGSLDV
ncbi:hypothetical protein BJ322DRAFT_94900 [Thelephora terrestris]|uniref:F-box domain-containing protein n=1 Tax=Thelephora terrestris TaxID=56493 RepID=A0A9P6HSY6_9AGAM|nr:hypothetical protein BJ322DRAFT_94900 [Thelephora terrestris]